MTAKGWGPRTRQHTFSTGRTAELRESLPVLELVRSGVFTPELVTAFEQSKGGKLADAALAVDLVDAVVCGMFVSPRVVRTVDEADAAIANGDDDVVPIMALEDDELTETVDAAFEAARTGATFRSNRGGARTGEDGEGVGAGAERAAGDAGGERGSVDDRPAARPAARGGRRK